MTLKEIPKKMVIIGSGAIGVEFAYFYATMGAEVTIVEYQKILFLLKIMIFQSNYRDRLKSLELKY